MNNIANQINVIKKSNLRNTEKTEIIISIIKANSRYISDESLFNLGLMCADLNRYCTGNNEYIFYRTIENIIGELEK